VNRTHRILGVTAAALGLGAAAADFRPAAGVMELAAEIEAERDHMSALDLGENIKIRMPNLRIYDLRSRAEYDMLHIPGAEHATLNDLLRAPAPRDSTIVLYSEGGGHSAQAWVLLRMRGYRKVFVLREGMYEWISRVHEPRLAVDATAAERKEFERAAELSRFFGGVPLAGVMRTEVPVGYWTGSSDTQPGRTQQAVTGIRRRGC
jgi:rhodanese-related sulfurtransferase